MDLVLCHTTADFDTLGAAVGVTCLCPGSRIVLTGGCHPTVREFLALHRDEYALIERRSVSPEQIRSLTVVDTQWRDRLGKASEWLDLPDIEITIYDHHSPGAEANGDIAATRRVIEPIGSATTLVVEELQAAEQTISGVEATVMALGIHVDTGSLTFDHATVRDAAALTWLMAQGASQRAIAEYVEPGLSPQLQDLLAIALDQLQIETVRGYSVAWVLLKTEGYVQGLSSLTSQLMTVTDSDVMLLAVRYGDESDERLTVIGRSRSWSYADGNTDLDLSQIFRDFGGGGHPRAAALTVRGVEIEPTVATLRQQVMEQIPHPPTARELMSSPVRTIRPDVTIGEAHRILLRYGHSGLSVVDESDQLVGIIARRDLDIALHHDFSHAPVKGFMTTNLETIAPETTLPDIEALMVTYDIGRLPVIDQGQLVGIVTRTDVLRQLHQIRELGSTKRNGMAIRESEFGGRSGTGKLLRRSCPLPDTVRSLLQERLTPALKDVLDDIAQQAEQRHWQLYLVGGAVRDLLLAEPDRVLYLNDVDLVVDGVQNAPESGAGVELGRALRQHYPNTRLQVHGRFQTAALLWHNDPLLDSLWLDVATARTEFYPYPAANPEVEASSIRQDLYRRDFTINALALRLTSPRRGELLDFFGGLLDLQAKLIRVLHANSFIEDPTRIYRAVRFAVRLGFSIEPQTEAYIRHAIASGIYHRVQTEQSRAPALQTRLKQELKYILQAPYWKTAIQLLDDLGALCCIHVDLSLTRSLWQQLRLGDRVLKNSKFKIQNSKFSKKSGEHTPQPPLKRGSKSPVPLWGGARGGSESRLEHWQVLLEILLTALPQGDRTRIANHLQLPADSIERLHDIDEIQVTVATTLPNCDRPSQIVELLEPYSLETLALLAVLSDRPIRRQIWHYLTQLAHIKSPLNGNDLKNLGYKPGRQFKQILDHLRSATLDGEISDQPQAEAFLAQKYPR